MTFFPGFSLDVIATPQGPIRLRRGGAGPAVVLLHGHPRTHATWEEVAPLLARDHAVICPDLPGFGGSYQPADRPDHSASSKRDKAAAILHALDAMEVDRFHLVGHDRGAATAFRLAMDHPRRVTTLTMLDGLPIVEHLDRADWRFARDWWHWFFFAQPDKPERAILADPERWYGRPRVSEAALADWREAVHNPEVVHGMVEDYRAALSVDHVHDRADRDARRRVACPLLVLWSLRDDLAAIYGDPLAIWRGWADDLRGEGIECGHHMAEEAPETLAAHLAAFFAAPRRPRRPG